MIPKKIHYCWFGRNPLPESAQKCIASWRKFMPDYEIIEWNEDNFDVNAIPYTAQAYAAKKYAFVSDYARFKILFEHGGLYFDTDVELIKPFDDIVSRGAFMGFEINAYEPNPGVNPGLGLGALPSMRFYQNLLEEYKSFQFLNTDGSFNQTTIVEYTTNALFRCGLQRVQGIQLVDEISIYPSDYFNPVNSNTGKLNLTPNTHSIHWYAKSWYDESAFRLKMSQYAHRIFGLKFSAKIKNLFRL